MTTASVVVPPDWDLEAIAAFAGNASVDDRWYRDGILFVRGVNQTALDEAAATTGAPKVTFAKAMSELNAAYQADVAAFRDAFTGAALAGGPTQAAKQEALAERFNARKAKYIADSAALRAQYGA